MKQLLLQLFTAIFTPGVQVMLARLAVRFGPRTLSFGELLVVLRWEDVREVLHRDQDFLIAPINAERITAVSGPFILGMDRSPELFRQRSCVYSAMRDADPKLVEDALKAGIEDCLSVARQNGGRLDVVNGYARLIAGRTACAFFGVKGPDEPATLR